MLSTNALVAREWPPSLDVQPQPVLQCHDPQLLVTLDVRIRRRAPRQPLDANSGLNGLARLPGLIVFLVLPTVTNGSSMLPSLESSAHLVRSPFVAQNFVFPTLTHDVADTVVANPGTHSLALASAAQYGKQLPSPEPGASHLCLL
eukprot:CAMPEP_0204131568 /NCGR_PEP_ID=MMETSP0361-20130328/14012_1 /ASSEMBLY_ACC=CAM_ASM_000343 /TAXON_ID=268821 /ORGANISM="Scrippsiella Hangoei, Strain SHTV-5" /LENGTH=145 /DNA_ID=CAMNT_0051084323 /DNA_START=318 /DNA_END=753 /DNA_ORIENTATION=+